MVLKENMASLSYPSSSLRSDWTDERVEKLKVMWLAGDPASAIAKALGGVTRSAVIGKVHRLCLVRPEGVTEANRVRGRKADGAPRARKPRAPHSVNYVRRPPRPKVARLTPDKARRVAYAAKLAEHSRKAPLLSLAAHGECKYATHEEAEHLFCALPTHDGASFCPGHSRLVYNPKPKGERTASLHRNRAEVGPCEVTGAANSEKIAA